MIFITLGDQKVGDNGSFNWYQSVNMPRSVILFDGPHPDLRKEFYAAELEARSRRVGTAFLAGRSRKNRTVTYVMFHPGNWSADARRSGTKKGLTLMGFAKLAKEDRDD